MPHVAITMFPGRDEETKRDLARKTQQLLVRELGVEPQYVSVSIQDVPADEWAQSMQRFSDDILFVKPGAQE